MSNIQQINHSISSFETYIKVSYQQAIDNLLSNVATQTEEDAKQIEYISNNLNTVESIIKTYVPSVSITTITQKIEPIDVYIIMENWCGSSAGNVPYIVNIMKTIKDAKIHIVPRDENEDFMNLYLSEGKKSIPIVIGFDKYGSELFKWGSFTTAQNEYAKT